MSQEDEIEEDFKVEASKPWISPNSTIPEDILNLDHSFGYNCKKLFNLCMLDGNTLAFISGNLIHFLSIENHSITFRRCSGDGGLGCIAVNPKYKHFTVAENGTNPLVVIYHQSTFKVLTILRNGAERTYSCMDYSRDGELLATQAGGPDYMLTIWLWKTVSIRLRVRSFGNEVCNVKFSLYKPDQLTTCGNGHIKFWKMSNTFTGLKLKGELGRFGTTKICDIYAAYSMADGQVLSGCEWGNILVWEDGVIKMEVCRKNRRACHAAPIIEILMEEEGEIMTVGMDGYIRTWVWETVEFATPPANDPFVEIEPIFEFRIGKDQHLSQLMKVIRRFPEEEKIYEYFAQDGNGGIWLCDLNPDETPESPRQIYHCHNGGIVEVAASPISAHILSVCEGGRLNFYDYEAKEILEQKQFSAAGAALIWLPLQVDPSGSSVVVGFEDGLIRVLAINLTDSSVNHIHLAQVLKPHTQGITRLSVNPKNSVLISAAKDHTIFINQLTRISSFVSLVPIGFIEMPSTATALNWRIHNSNFSNLLIGCEHGEILECCDLPQLPQKYTDVTYNLKDITIKKSQFKSVKSELIAKLNKAEGIARKFLRIYKHRKDNRSMQTESFSDSVVEEEQEKLYVPEIPSRVHWLRETAQNTILVSMSGYDAGYIYEYNFNEEIQNISNIEVPDADDLEILSFLYTNDYLVFGLSNGCIRLTKYTENIHDMSDYWQLGMHDNLNGNITALVSSYDGRYLFSVGLDGNLFSFKWNKILPRKEAPPVNSPFEIPANIYDLEDSGTLSLEQKKQKDEYDRRQKITTERKEKMLEILSGYKAKFKEILKENSELPKSQQFPLNTFELDPRITQDLTQSLDKQLQLVQKKYAHDVEKATVARQKVTDYFIKPLKCFPFEVSGIRDDVAVKSFRIHRLDEEFYAARKDLEERIEKEKNKSRVLQLVDEVESVPHLSTVQSEETFLEEFSASTVNIKFSSKMKRFLEKYRSRKTDEKQRKFEWEKLEAEKPDINRNHPEDDVAIEEVQKTIGDYKLKTDPDYKPSDGHTVLTKYRQVLQVREEIYEIRNEFNERLTSLRSKKSDLYKEFENDKQKLAAIHKKLPKKFHKNIPEYKSIDDVKEYPENILKKIPENFSQPITTTSIVLQQRDSLANNSKTEKISLERNEEIDLDRLECETLGLGPETVAKTFAEVCKQIDKFPILSETNVDLLLKLANSEEETPWETELKYLKTVEHRSQQDLILADVEERIQEFDSKLQKLQQERLLVAVDAKFLENFLSTLNQELWILQDFERVENDFIEKIDEHVVKRNEKQSEIIQAKNFLVELQKSMDEGRKKLKTMKENFLEQLKGQPFDDFLLKIYKKKYRSPITDKSKEFSQSSHQTDDSDMKDLSSSSEEVTNSEFNETICPSGCSRWLYDEVLIMRARKQELEQNVQNCRRECDENLKRIEEHKAKINEIDEFLNAQKEELLKTQREKQQKLNEVETVVILRFDQIQHFKTPEEFENIDASLLFKTENLTKLYARVDQLAAETLEVRRSHKVNILHLARMKSDCELMERQIYELNEQTKEAMIKKFGKVINLDELEESVLRRYVFDLKSNVDSERKEIEKEIAAQKDVLAEIETELIKETQIGIEKQNILTVLLEEKNFLTELLISQRKLKSKIGSEKPLDFKQDLKKLNDISTKQEQQIEHLEKEIRTLRWKSKPLGTGFPECEPSACFSEILPPSGDRDYEEDAFTYGTPNSGSEPNLVLLGKISLHVKGFLARTVGCDQLKEERLHNFITRFSKYLAYVVSNLDAGQTGCIMESVIENVQQMVSQKYLDSIKPEDIMQLVEEVITIYATDGEGETDIGEIVKCIVSNSVENAEQLKSTNLTQDILLETYRQLFEIFSIDQIRKEDTVKKIATHFLKVEKFEIGSLDFVEFSKEMDIFLRDNLIDNVTVADIQFMGDKLLSELNFITEKQ